jgi:hypothetical protein
VFGGISGSTRTTLNMTSPRITPIGYGPSCCHVERSETSLDIAFMAPKQMTRDSSFRSE